MTTPRERAEELRQTAIQELLTERHAIDEMLRTLGHGKGSENGTAPLKRRGRPPKVAVTTIAEEAPAS